MANATQEQAQVPPEAQKALLRKLESLEKVHAASVECQAKFNRRIADDIAAITEAVRALTSAPDSAKAATEDAGDEGTRRLAPDEQAELLATLQHRLEQKPAHYTRPEGIVFADIERALEANPAAMWSLAKMEKTGGEPDVVAVEDDAFIFADCSKESPAGRRNCVYDKKAEKDAKPNSSGSFNGNAVQMAEEFGVDLWSEDFWKMQMAGKYDYQSWSWLQTPAEIRRRGGALIIPVRDDHIILPNYHPASHHSDDGGWRGLLRVQKVS